MWRGCFPRLLSKCTLDKEPVRVELSSCPVWPPLTSHLHSIASFSPAQAAQEPTCGTYFRPRPFLSSQCYSFRVDSCKKRLVYLPSSCFSQYMSWGQGRPPTLLPLFEEASFACSKTSLPLIRAICHFPWCKHSTIASLKNQSKATEWEVTSRGT